MALIREDRNENSPIQCAPVRPHAQPSRIGVFLEGAGGEPFEFMSKTYADKLRDPRWQKMRLLVMQRDSFCCRICLDGGTTLNVHHSYYGKGRNPWEYDSEHLVTLCEDCHSHVEKTREEILRTMTWEIPIESLHRIATCSDQWLVSEISSAFTDRTEESCLKASARRLRRAIDRLSEIADAFDSGKNYWQMSEIDRPIGTETSPNSGRLDKMEGAGK